MKEQQRIAISENIERIDLYIQMITEQFENPDLVNNATIIDHLEHMGDCTDNILHIVYGGGYK